MSKKKPKIPVALYRLTQHINCVEGPIDYFSRVWLGDKILWEGIADENQIITIDEQELFGGLRQQGGASGDMHVLLGDPSQLLSDFLAAKIGQASGADSPAFRHLAGLWFTETAGSELPGFYWQANSPFLPAVEAEPNYIPDDWYPAKAAIGGTEDPALTRVSVNSPATQEQVRDISTGNTGSTLDFWNDLAGWYYDHARGERVYGSQNMRLFQDIVSTDPVHLGSTENEEWDGSFRLMGISGDGRVTTERYSPGYLFGVLSDALSSAFIWRLGDPNKLFAQLTEWNYTQSRLYRFDRANPESPWIVDPDFVRSFDVDPTSPQLYLLGFRDSDGELVVHEESSSDDNLQIRRKSDFSIISSWTISDSPDSFLSAYQKCMLPGDVMVSFTNLSSNVTEAGVRTALHKFDLQTGVRTHQSGWGVGTGPYSEPHVTPTGTSNGDSCWPVFMQYNRQTERLILIFRIPGEFSDTTLYYDYVWASFDKNLGDYVYHGRVPWSGLRTSADAPATGFNDAAFVRFGVEFGSERNRNCNVDGLKSAEFEKIALEGSAYEVSGTSFVNRGGMVMVVDTSDGMNVVYDWSDRLEQLDLYAEPVLLPTTPAFEQMIGVETGTGTNPFPQAYLMYDGDAKIVSGYPIERFANYLEAGHRFGTQVITDDAPVIKFDFDENAPIYFIGPGARCPLANPMHIIRDVLLLDAGADAADDIDDAAARYMADIMWRENLGLSILWSDSATAEQFIDEILDHAAAVRYPSPHTGRLVFKAIRGDYDVSNLRRLNRSVGVLAEFKRKGWGETVNQMDITYTDPENEDDKTVRLHEPGNIAQQGSISGDSRNYHGVRSPELAMDLARRELRVASYPLATMEFEATHQFWDAVPAGVFLLDWTFRNGDTIEDMAVRVVDVDRSHMENGIVRLNLTEDIFALPQAQFAAPPTGSEFITREDPAELAYVQFLSIPYFFGVNLIDASVASNIDEAADETFFIILGAQTGADTTQYDVYGEETDSLGNTSFVTFGLNDVVARAVLTQALPAEAQTTLAAIENPTQGPLPVVGTWIVIGDGPEADGELAIVSAVSPATVIERGMLDTTPKDWPAGTPIWIISQTADIVDNTPVAPGSYNYKLLTITSLGTLPLADAQLRTPSVVNRHYRPLRPANVVANGVSFGSVDRRGETDVDLTWSRRNRLTEDAQVNMWTDGDVTPEAGATVTVQALNFARDTVLGEDTGLSGTSHSILATKWGSERDGYVKVISETAGDESFQGHEIYVFFDLVGRGEVVLPVPIILGSQTDIVGQGTVAVPVPTLSATATIVTAATGAITSVVPTLSGAAEQIQAATGAIAATVPVLDGLGSNGTFSFAGGILTTVPVLSGSGTVTPQSVKSGSGAINATVPLLGGAGIVEGSITGSGAITTPAPALAGVGERVVAGSGAIAAPLPTLSGQAEQIQAATGAIVTPAPFIGGTAFVLGTGIDVVGFGGIVTPLPTIQGFGAVGAPQRTVENVSAQSSVSVSIPAGCTRFAVRSTRLILSDNSANFQLQLFNTGDTVNSPVDCLDVQSAAAVIVTHQSSATSFGFVAADSSTTDRWCFAELNAARDASARTTFRCLCGGKASGTDETRERQGAATAAQDDDTIRILCSAGTFSGDIYFDFYFT